MVLPLLLLHLLLPLQVSGVAVLPALLVRGPALPRLLLVTRSGPPLPALPLLPLLLLLLLLLVLLLLLLRRGLAAWGEQQAPEIGRKAS